MAALKKRLFWGLKKALRSRGVDLVRYDGTHHWVRFMRQLERAGINLYLDVGANTGQHVELLRNIGYRGRIVSFEPVGAVYEQLEKAADDDPKWTALKYALGDADAESKIHLSENSLYSSLLPVTDRFPADSRVVGEERIKVRRLDAVLDEFAEPGEKIFLKIDAQGYERQILEGAAGVIGRISGIVAELSLVPTYEGETLYRAMDDYLRGLGFIATSYKPHTTDEKTGQLLQMDVLYFRPEAIGSD